MYHNADKQLYDLLVVIANDKSRNYMFIFFELIYLQRTTLNRKTIIFEALKNIVQSKFVSSPSMEHLYIFMGSLTIRNIIGFLKIVIPSF